MSEIKKLCKASKDEYCKKKYKKHVNNPHYLCKKCGRLANDDSKICKSEPIIRDT